MALPRLTRTPDGYHCVLEGGARLEFLRLRQARGGVHSGVWTDVVLSVKQDNDWVAVHESRYNLSSPSTRRDMAKFFATRIHLPGVEDDKAWLAIVDSVCSAVCRAARQGKVPVNLGDKEDPGPAKYLVEKLLEDHQLTILYGDKSSGKSQLALALGYAVQEQVDGLLGLETQTCPVLYLDWETGEDEQVRRLYRMARGLEAPSIPPLQYVAMERPLADDVDSLRNRAEGSLVIIDSLVPACGGDAREEAATGFWHAVRALNSTVLCIAQTQKNEQAKGKRKSVFGSTMFSYAARSIWLVRGYQEMDSRDLHIALSHEKSNNGPLLKPLGWCATFTTDATSFQFEDPKAVAEFNDMLPLAEQISQILRTGSHTLSDLASQLGRSEATIKTVLYRHKQRFVRHDEGWGLLAGNSNE